MYVGTYIPNCSNKSILYRLVYGNGIFSVLLNRYIQVLIFMFHTNSLKSIITSIKVIFAIVDYNIICYTLQ